MDRRADRVDAAIWAVVGLVILIASLRIDRLQNLGINPWSIPGLTPAVVGLLMILVAAGLAWSSRRAETAEPAPAGADRSGASLRQAAIAAALCIAFAGIALGRGLPFAVDAALFIAVFITVFSWADWRREAGGIRRGLMMAVPVAIATSVFIAWLFESIFLVRLP